MKKLALVISAILASGSVYAVDNELTLNMINSNSDTAFVTQSSQGDEANSSVIVDFLNTESNDLYIDQSSQNYTGINVLIIDSQDNYVDIDQASLVSSNITVDINDSQNNGVKIDQISYQGWAAVSLNNSQENCVNVFQRTSEADGVYVSATDSNGNYIQVNQGDGNSEITYSNADVFLVNAQLNDIRLSQQNTFGDTIEVNVGLTGSGSTTESNSITVSHADTPDLFGNNTSILVNDADNNVVGLSVTGSGNQTDLTFADETSDMNAYNGTVVGSYNSINVSFEESMQNQVTTGMFGDDNSLILNFSEFSDRNAVDITQNGSSSQANINLIAASTDNDIDVVLSSGETYDFTLVATVGDTININQ